MGLVSNVHLTNASSKNEGELNSSSALSRAKNGPNLSPLKEGGGKMTSGYNYLFRKRFGS